MQQPGMLGQQGQPQHYNGMVAAPAGSAPGQQQGPLQSSKPRLRRRVLTSLWLQVFIFFGAWWDVFYYVLNILVFVYKGTQLPYPSRNFAMEFSFSWLWFLLEIPRLFLLTKGNKSERVGPIIFSFVLALPLLGMYIYFIAFQTYVLKIDQIWNGIALGFLCVQLLFGSVAGVRFIMATRFQS